MPISTHYLFGVDFSATGLMRRRIIDRTWWAGYSILGMPLVYGAIQISSEHVAGGTYSYLGMPLIMWNCA